MNHKNIASLPMLGHYNKANAEAGLTFANDEASLNGGNGEGELLQAPWWPHVPITMSTTSASAPRAWRTSSLHTVQQVCDDAGCVLRSVRGAHNLSNPIWGGAVIYGSGKGERSEK